MLSKTLVVIGVVCTMDAVALFILALTSSGSALERYNLTVIALTLLGISISLFSSSRQVGK